MQNGKRLGILRRHPVILLGVALLLAALAFFGFRGYHRAQQWWTSRTAPKDQDKKGAGADQNEPFDINPMRVVPLDQTTAGANFTKPNHVVEGIWEARSNRRDLSGWLSGELVWVSGQQPIPLPGSRYYLSQTRRVALPKGQFKRFAMPYFIAVDDIEKRVAIHHRLSAARDSGEIVESFDPVTLMPAHQFLLVVAAGNSDRYGFLKSLDSIRQPTSESAIADPDIYYRVVLVEGESRVGLPSGVMGWTAVAHVVWDQFSYDGMTDEQMKALVDWLHWGGQLIVSGPGSLDSLKGSFLEPYLPASPIEARGLTNDDFVEFNETFGLTEAGTSKHHRLDIPQGSKLQGVELQLAGDARFVPRTGRLVAERRVGRGRIVVTAFPISDRFVINWRGFDSFFNSCLLARPPRMFLEVDYEPAWRFLGANRTTSMSGWTREPLLHSGVRFFARDTGLSAVIGKTRASDHWRWDGSRSDRLSGVAGWNDSGTVANTALETLRTASGIDVPEADFVWRSVGLYLLVLVPINWLVFRFLGRIEWAWAAVPVIAIASAVLVVRAARLDIGFVRSRTEVGVLEFHAGYDRAHLSRFVSIYTSLATNFALTLEGSDGLARPASASDRETVLGYYRARLVRGERTRLEGFQVESNSADTIHTEQFIPMGGPCELIEGPSGDELANRSKLALRGIGVIRRDRSGRLLKAWVGRLDPGKRKSLSFQPVSNPAAPWFRQWDENPTSRPVSSSRGSRDSARLSLAGLLDVALRNLWLRPGEARLVGWIDQPLPGISLDPPIAQTTGATLVVGHLRFAHPAPPSPDHNLLVDVLKQRKKKADEDAAPDASGRGLNP